jgi:hypothetical protein
MINNGENMPSIYANPYDTSAHGFYFEDYQDFMDKYRKNVNRFGAPVEEYSFEFISGDDAEQALFMAMEDNGFIDLQGYFDLLNNIDQSQVPALVYLMDIMNLDAEQAMANVDDVIVIEDDAITYISEYFVPDVFFDETTYENLHPMLIDFKALGRDFAINHPEIRDLGYAPYDAGMYVYENWLEEDLGNVSKYGISPDYYLDEQALLRDMMNAQQIDEFRIMGKTYTIANKDDVQNMRNNPALCKNGVVSSSGWPGVDKSKRGVCTKHGGVDRILGKSEYTQFKPNALYDKFGKKRPKSPRTQKSLRSFVTYRSERHPDIERVLKQKKKK